VYFFFVFRISKICFRPKSWRPEPVLFPNLQFLTKQQPAWGRTCKRTPCLTVQKERCYIPCNVHVGTVSIIRDHAVPFVDAFCRLFPWGQDFPRRASCFITWRICVGSRRWSPMPIWDVSAVVFHCFRPGAPLPGQWPRSKCPFQA
jgi:hypothetical protein